MLLSSTASASDRGCFVLFFELGLFDECSSVVVLVQPLQPCPSVAVEKQQRLLERCVPAAEQPFLFFQGFSNLVSRSI
jgi:hypothetical protein